MSDATPIINETCEMKFCGDEFRCPKCGYWTYAYNDILDCPLGLPRKEPMPSKGSNMAWWLSTMLPRKGSHY
jgi:hypothetical protein